MKDQDRTAEYESLVLSHHADVWHSARRILHSDDEARDVAQEVFLRILDGRLRIETAPDCDETRRLLRWWSIRIALNSRRGAKRRRAREDAHAMTYKKEVRQMAATEGEQLWSHVQDLPHDLRVPLMLRFAEGSAFGEIGAALGIAESTAHERVQRGLVRLRAALERAGLTALALEVETRLGGVAPDGYAPGSAPAGLANTILGRGAAHGAAASAAAPWPIGAMALAGAGAVVVLLAAGSTFGSNPADGAATESIARPHTPVATRGESVAVEPGSMGRRSVALGAIASVAPGPPSEGELGSGGGADPADEPTGVAVGRIVDGSLQPIAGCEVSVYSTQRQGKAARYCSKTVTDGAGRFTVSVELADEGSGQFRVQAVHEAFAGTTSPPKRLRTDQTTDFGDLTVDAGGELGAGSYELTLDVLDPRGAPVAGARVVLSSVALFPVSPGFPSHQWLHRGDRLERQDARQVTDESGRVTFTGDRIGRKSIVVTAPSAAAADGRPPGSAFAPRLVRFSLTDGAVRKLVVVLDQERTLDGHLRLVDGGFPADYAKTLQLHVMEPTTGEWRFATIGSQGRFHLGGLGAGIYRLRVAHDPGGQDQPRLSAGWLDAESGSADIDLALKRVDDIRDIGCHAAELHGRFVGAREGHPIVLSYWALDVERVDIPAGIDVERDWLPNHAFPRPVQRGIGGSTPPDSDSFHRTGLEAQTLVVRCMQPGWAAYVSAPISLGPREVVSEMTIKLQRPSQLEGSVLGPNGDALEGAFVFVTGVGPDSDATVATSDIGYREADGRGFFFANGSGRRAEGGRYQLDSLPGGLALRVVALHPAHEPAIGPVVTLDAGQALTGVELRFVNMHPR